MRKLVKSTILLSIISVVLISCENSNTAKIKEIVKVEMPVSEAVYQKGFEILESNCISCHSPKGSFDDRIAPPLSAVKNNYLKGNVSKEEFIASFVSFVENPEIANSKMPEAIEKFNLMPKMGYSKEQLTAVAEYIYSNEVQNADWYKKHFLKEKSKYANFKMTDLERGQQLAMKTKSVLGKNLMGTIKKKGTAEALKFCNVEAFPLVDSMATLQHAKIKRVSDKPRNENNIANEQELTYINAAIAKLAKGEKLTSEIYETEGTNVAYYPITTNDMCLKCHGTPKEEIKESTMNLLSKLYPNDKAVGYKVNQLRGIWVVEFE